MEGTFAAIKRLPLVVIVVAALALMFVVGLAAASTVGDDRDELLTGTEAGRAAAAALERVDGLSIVQAIAVAHGGKAGATNRPAGADVYLVLPDTSEPAA